MFYDSDAIDRMGPGERIRAHVHYHDTIIVDCYPGVCPFRERRKVPERRNVFSKWGWLKMMWYVVFRPDRRKWKNRRTHGPRDHKKNYRKEA